MIERVGWMVTEPIIPDPVLDRLAERLTPLFQTNRGYGGVRNLLELVPEVCELSRSKPIRDVAESILGTECFAVRSVFFDKTPQTNWKVTWHQDLTIAVQRRIEVNGFEPWTEKAGIPHVQPPITILERMLAVRVHLDDCMDENGPVRVLPGSHKSARLSPKEIEQWKTQVEPVACLVPRGGILVFRPLILHASSPAQQPGHRRVIHLEFAAEDLPGGLEWQGRW